MRISSKKSIATKSSASDQRHMAVALALGRRGLGRVWPNPAVGCTIVQGGNIVGRGWTQPGGSPHAETEALDRAGDKLKGSTVYVSLEPCSHLGKTPPCVDKLIEAGISRCVVAVEDPDPRVSGRGVTRLREAGIDVEVGVMGDLAREINEGFFSRITRGRPLVTLKIATTLDGCIATGNGESRWITGPKARLRAHVMRAEHDAILIGIGTAKADDPMLTCRLPGMAEMSPVRVVLDSNLRLPLTHELAATARDHPTWIMADYAVKGEQRVALEDCGIEIFEVEGGVDGHLSVDGILKRLAGRGVTRLMVEGGRTVASTFLRARLVDRVAWFRAPTMLGGEGIKVTTPLGIGALTDAIRLRHMSREALNEDVLDMFSFVA